LTSIQEKFFALLRIALSSSDGGLSVFPVCGEEDWLELQDIATKQGLLGVAFAGISRLPAEKRPPLGLLHQWAGEAELIRGHNALLNREAARLTDVFVAQGRKTAILKGPANARLYPDPYNRQGGDIDIWVSGGRESVVRMLDNLGMSYDKELGLFESGHHLHLKNGSQGLDVEIHFKPSSGIINPFANRRLQCYLDGEIAKSILAPEGFYVPPTTFALVMQLAHIQRHFWGRGIGLRQLTDYFVLLLHSTQEERDEVAIRLEWLGLARTCGALMWLLGHVFGMDSSRMLCKPDKWRGKWMLNDVISGGNFGFHSAREQSRLLLRRIRKRWRSIRLFAFDPLEAFWNEYYYCIWIFRSLPLRIKLRRLSLKGMRR
jgi:hypothetical protein